MDQIDCKATGRGEDIVERYCQLFQIWIEEDENPTCQKLIEALRSLKKCGLAKMVKKIVTNKEDSKSLLQCAIYIALPSL